MMNSFEHRAKSHVLLKFEDQTCGMKYMDRGHVWL